MPVTMAHCVDNVAVVSVEGQGGGIFDQLETGFLVIWSQSRALRVPVPQSPQEPSPAISLASDESAPTANSTIKAVRSWPG